MRRLTASSLGRAEACIGSVTLPGVEESGAYAATGQARYKRIGLVVLKWTLIAAFGFFAVLVLLQAASLACHAQDPAEEKEEARKTPIGQFVTIGATAGVARTGQDPSGFAFYGLMVTTGGIFATLPIGKSAKETVAAGKKQ